MKPTKYQLERLARLAPSGSVSHPGPEWREVNDFALLGALAIKIQDNPARWSWKITAKGSRWLAGLEEYVEPGPPGLETLSEEPETPDFFRPGPALKAKSQKVRKSRGSRRAGKGLEGPASS